MVNIAWMAGLFEGEGSLSAQTTGRASYQMRIEMSDKDVLDRFCELAECGTVKERGRRQPHHKFLYRWACYKKEDVTRLLSSMLPYMGERRAFHFLNALDYLDGCFNCTPPEPIALG
jgi:hypothetical protein